MNLIFIRSAATFLLLVLSLLNYGANETPAFDQLKERFENNEVFTAGFSHEYKDSYTGESSYANGKIWVAKGEYRVEGDEQVMIIDGEISRVYDSIRNRLLISDYDEEEDDFAPSRMLRGVDEAYRVSEEKLDEGTLVILESDDIFAVFMRVEIRLNEEGTPITIEATDQAENSIITTFDEGCFTGYDASLFELNVPEDAEIVDLRY